ncbi:MAG: leucine-rich repeat protein [Treponema sp.]|nr:leucine-rich repeat protein [Treponema sp.]
MADNRNFIIKQDPEYEEIFYLYSYLGDDSVVEVPEGVTKIRSYAFGDKNKPNDTITKIILPDSVVELENSAFGYCTALTDVRWSENPKFKMGNDIFVGCNSLEEITIPKNVNSLSSFLIPKNLKKINIHDDLTKVMYSCFHYDPDEVDDFDEDYEETIRILSKNPNYKMIDCFMVNEKHKTALFCIPGDRKTVHVPHGIEVIGDFCFWGLHDGTSIEKIVLPKSVRKIVSGAFAVCKDLKSVIYEGKSKDLEIERMAFFYPEDNKDFINTITCSDTPKQKQMKNRKNMEALTRMLRIDDMLRNGNCPDVPHLAEMFKVRECTIYRTFDDILLFSGTECPKRTDLIEYDSANKSYHYTRDFTLDIGTTLLNL